LLASLNPKNITNGAKIDVTDALSIFNQKQFHHIYPKAYLKSLGVNDRQINLISNMCMLVSSENNYISDRNPNEYFPVLVDKLGSQYCGVFESNLLPVLSMEQYKTLSYEKFLLLRIELIHKRMLQLCSGEA